MIDLFIWLFILFMVGCSLIGKFWDKYKEDIKTLFLILLLFGFAFLAAKLLDFWGFTILLAIVTTNIILSFHLNEEQSLESQKKEKPT